jgi:hypothetical protein
LQSQTWEVLSEQYRGSLPFQVKGLQTHLYCGYQHAVWEVTQTLVKLFSHKRTIVFASQEDPALEILGAQWAGLGCKVKSLKPSELNDPSSWFESVKDDLLFVLTASDDPITGRVYPQNKLRETLNGKRVFHLDISHSAFRFSSLNDHELRPFDVKIWSLAPERALAISGERYKAWPSVAPILPWSPISSELIQSDLLQIPIEQCEVLKEAVEHFESNLPAGFQCYFGPGDERVYDRAVFFHPQINGSAAVDALVSALNLPLNRPGQPNALETISGCRWESHRLISWLAERGDTEEQIRGLMMIDAEFLSGPKAPEIQQYLSKIASKII